MDNKHSQYLEKRKEEILKKEILSPENFNFYRELFLFIEKYSEEYSCKDVLNHPSKVFPLLVPSELSISQGDAEILVRSLGELAELLKKHHQGLDLSAVVTYYTETKNEPGETLRSLLSLKGDEFEALAAKFRIGIEELLFVLMNWYKPFLIKLRHVVFSNIDASEWHENRCPFCGNYPNISKIVEMKENQRKLHCQLCDNEWHYVRIGCVICGINEMSELGYYEFEGKPEYRIDYCNSCKGYIKTIRIPRQFDEGRYDLAVEDIITNFLDASALSMGYKRL